LRSSESDLQETLRVKETQLDVLRMRLNEADRLLELEKQRITDLQSEKDRLGPTSWIHSDTGLPHAWCSL